MGLVTLSVWYFFMASQALRIEQLPIRGKNSDRRQREYLFSSEIEILLTAAKQNIRSSQRNYCLILLGYKHGLRASEFGLLRWDSIDWERGTIAITRVKGSDSGTHHLNGKEIRELRKLKRESENQSPFIFLGERGGPLAATAISAIVKRMGIVKGIQLLGFPIHAHMLRHTCGYLLAECGTDIRITQAWLGHREISNTVKYTKLSSSAFKGIDI